MIKIFNSPFSELSRPLYGDVKEINIPQEVSFRHIDKDEIKLLIQTSNAIQESLNFSDACRKIVDVFREYLQYVIGVLFLFDQEKRIVYPHTISSTLLKPLEKIFGKPTSDHIGSLKEIENFVVKCERSKKSYVGTDVRDFVSPVLSEEKAHKVQKLFRMKTFILTPIFVGGEFKGALLLASKRDGVEEKEREIIGFVRNQIQITLCNSILHEKVKHQLAHIERQYNELQAIHSINNYIANIMSFDELAQKSIDALVGNLGFKMCLFFLVNHQTKELYLYKMSCKSGKEKKLVEIVAKMRGELYNWRQSMQIPEENLLARCATTGSVPIGDDLNAFLFPMMSKSVLKVHQFVFGTKSYMCGPLRVKDAIEGVVFVAHHQGQEDILERKDTFIACLNQVGLALENTQLYQQLMKKIEQLQEATTAYSVLEQLDRAKTEFLSIVSHQLRTPLTSIRGNVCVLGERRRGEELSTEQKEAMRNIMQSTERLSLVVEDVLGVAQIETGRMSIAKTSEDLLETFSLVAEQYERLAMQKGIQFTITKRHRKIILPHDGLKMKQCFANILDNAISYTMTGSVSILLSKEKKDVCIKITDTGIGIPAEFLPYLGNKFSRGENAKKIRPDGSGVGIYLAKHFIEGHGGTVTVESPVREGRRKIAGTRIVIRMPLV